MSFSIIFIHSPTINQLHLIRSVCYQSIEDPTIFTIISYSYPTSPDLVNLKIDLIIFPIARNMTPEHLTYSHHFVKINDKCHISLLIRVKKYSYRQMSMVIQIRHTWDKSTVLAKFGYKFYPNFNSGHYEIFDRYMNFGISIIVYEGVNNYIQKPNFNTEKFIQNLKMIAHNKSDICLVTESDKPIVIRPYIISDSQNGFITDFVAKYMHDGSEVMSVRYPAFECHSGEVDVNDSIFYIVEQYPNTTMHFEINYQNYNDIFNKESTVSLKFYLGDITIINVDDSIYLPPSSKKLFLISSKNVTKYCPDGTRRFLYQSNKGTIYYAKELKKIQVSALIYRWQWINHSIIDSCVN